MRNTETNELVEIGAAHFSNIASSAVVDHDFRLDASAFLRADGRFSLGPSVPSDQTLSDLADVYTVYIQTPLLQYVEPFPDSRPYLTTSELGEYQQGALAHVSLLTDPRLIDWEVKPGYIVLSRSGRVGEAYWVHKRLDGVLVGDSFRVVPRDSTSAYFLYAILSSQYTKDYMTGASYGSVVDHASVDQARTLTIPQIQKQVVARIVGCAQKGLGARDRAYDLLEDAQAALMRKNALSEIRVDKRFSFDQLGQPDCFDVASRSIAVSNGVGSEYRLDAHFYNPTAQLAVSNITKCRAEVKTIGELASVLFAGGRFKRTYVESTHGVPFLSGKNIVQIRPTDLKYLSRHQVPEIEELILQRGWILVTRSGTIGRTCFVWGNYEDYAASEHILRVIPDEKNIDPGYLYAFLSSQYGYEQILRYRHGSVIDEITDKQMENVLVPCPARKDQEEIGDMVREAYEKRAEAIRLEDEAQAILLNELTKTQGAKGV